MILGKKRKLAANQSVPCLHRSMVNESDRAPEKRVHKRFIVSGSAEIELDGKEISGKVVSVGAGGLLVVCDHSPPPGTEVRLDFAVWGLASEFPVSARGKVVWTHPGKVGLEFIGEPDGLKALLIFLEREHCCWSGTD